MKICKSCSLEKLLVEFHKDARRPDGIRIYCKECQKKRASTPEAKKYHNEYRSLWTITKYGITKEYYDTILIKQNGVCAICKKFRLRTIDRRMHIDHCHTTGKVRGILCSVCNTMLGKYEKYKSEIIYYLGQDTREKK